VVGAIASSLTLLGLGTGSALTGGANGTPQKLPTSANVLGGVGTPANIECSWALPDLNLSGGLEQNNTGTPNPTAPKTMWYGLDDDPLTKPNPVPCDLAKTGNGHPTQADNQHHLIQVLPNNDDMPAMRRIELWAAAEHIDGLGAISDVYWKVFHGDGSFKVQLHGVRIDSSSKNPDCTGPVTANPNDPAHTTMFQAAIANGELTDAAVNDQTNGMVSLCREGVKAFFHNTFVVSKDQPNGEYKIETHVVAIGGTETVQTYFIDIIPFFNMALDFNAVNFGQIFPGVAKTINGDTNFGTGGPTVENQGNSAMGLGLNFDDLVQMTDQSGHTIQGGKHITQFDASFGLSAATIQHIPLINSGVQANFDDAGARQLCSNDDGKLDLSVEPPGTLPAGGYSGTVSIIARSPATSLCPTDHGHVYVPNSGTRGAT
jgi:hypothetical protein